MSDDTPTVIPLESLSKMPRCVYQEYAGDLKSACQDYLAKFHRLPEVVYQYKYHYFFPIEEE